MLLTHRPQLTMQQAILVQFPTANATYRFTNRALTTLFTRQSVERFRTAVSRAYGCNLSSGAS